MPSFSAGAPPSPARFDLAISFDIDNKLLRATGKIEIEPGQGLELVLPELEITDALLSSPMRENAPIQMHRRDLLLIPAAEVAQTLLISWKKTVDDSFSNLISDRAIVLTSAWHPIPREPALFSLSAMVPDGFTALTQADHLAETDGENTARFSFSQPLQSIAFVAAPYEKQRREVRPGLDVYTMFFKEDRDLADGYLDAAVEYIRRYEEMIGTFPYNHYVIAENIMPTGFGLPTFTLLGRQVIRLPFIKETSLGHEILHSWFGNSVDIAPGSGNWSEGLTTYLADMAYRDDRGEGAQARKEAIRRYQDYITADAPNLDGFLWAGHDRITGQANRVVGYQKSAMLFHELARRVGDQVFQRGVQRLYQDFRSGAASWQDIKMIFEEESGHNLDLFFSQRLQRNDLPQLSVSGIAVTQGSEDAKVSLTVSQDQSSPYDMLLPVIVETVNGATRFERLITDQQTELEFRLDGTPLAVVIDPDYDLMRSLTPEEAAPTWSSLLGAEDCVVVIDDAADRQRFESFIELTGRYGCSLRDSSEITQTDLESRSIIFIGTTSPQLRKLYSDPGHPDSGFTLEIRKNPFNDQQAMAIVSSNSREDTDNVAHRLSHYGKYSYLHFSAGKLVEKRVPETSMGIRVELEEKPSGLALAELDPFDSLIRQLAEKQVVYVGETHTSRADHLLQMMVIEGLHAAGKNLAIGLEMFPRSSQPALDRYINDPEFSESDFIRESKYYQVWGYDYRLFRPIFTFARKHKIPLVGLNIEREIVSSVFKNGSLESLTNEQRDMLPAEMRLDYDGYVERLALTHRMHTHGNLAEGGLPGFIRAQALWDETMAETITRYLEEHPDSTMVVLAGNQHTRKDSGIAPRVRARIDADQASVLNLATNRASAAELSTRADYLFLLESAEFGEQGKIGVVLQEKEGADGAIMEILEVNPQSGADEAGIRKDDILIFIDELAIHTMDDVRLALLDKAAGETVRVSVIRGGETTGEQIEMEVELFNPSLPAGHP